MPFRCYLFVSFLFVFFRNAKAIRIAVLIENSTQIEHKTFTCFHFVWYVRFSFKKHIIFIKFFFYSVGVHLKRKNNSNNNNKYTNISNGWMDFSHTLPSNRFFHISTFFHDYWVGRQFLFGFCKPLAIIVVNEHLVSSRVDQTSLFVCLFGRL